MVAHRAALAGKTPIELLDDHSIPVDFGLRKHWFVSIPVFFRTVAVPELWSCRTAPRNRRVKGPDRSGGLHVGIRFFGVPCSRHLRDYSIPGKWSTREPEDRTGEGTCSGSVNYSSSSEREAAIGSGLLLADRRLTSVP